MQNMGHQDIPALVIDNVSKMYIQWQRSGKMKDIVKNLFSPEKREIKALDRLSFKVSKGEFLAYAGANGAGKSTTIKILSGILQPSSGKISVLGMAPGKERIKLMENIGVLFGQRTELWWDHPVITSYEWKKSVWNIPQDIFDENLTMVTELLDLSDILKTFARELSLGQRIRADLGMLLLHNPQIIFLDEPTLGLDVLAKKKMINFLKKLNREKGTTIVVTSHDMDDLEEMAERIILLSKGQIAFDGNFEELRKVQNSSSRLIITSTGEAPDLDEMEFIGSEDGKHSYKFDKERIKINDIFKKLSQYTEIVDVEIIKAPIEDIIADLYNSWKK